jgi:hypothetical protein
VAGFQVPDLQNAQVELSKIVQERAAKGLLTHSANARQILAKSSKGLP